MSAPREPIAIVGIGCRFPGGVDSAATFWRLVLERVDAIGEIPRDRFDLDAFYDPRPASPGKVNTRFGGFLSGIDTFDAEFFGIAPREAERLDPQQRLLLEVGWEAIEDAGMPIGSLLGSPTGVFVGMWLNDYEGRLFSDASGPDFYMTTGSGRYSASGRLSYAFGLQGPSLTVDTACSSSLAAVHLACQSIWAGESQLALAGGANVILQPHISVAYSQSQMLAPDGRCKFGDSRADGYVRSEGAALVALKPLSLAQRDADRIYAVILGGSVNNDGRSSGFMTTPGQGGQEDMLRKAYRHAGVSPGLVAYVEAHGTGTRAGDPVELGALGAVLAEGREVGRPCAVGSVKTNFGHTEGAAGVAGLIKASLCLHHGVIPASLHMQQPSPVIPWSTLPLYVPTSEVPWPAANGRMLAGVSAFGIAGTNAHLVLANAPSQETRAASPLRGQVLALSATKQASLQARARAQRDLLASAQKDPAFSLADVCYSAGARRTHHELRLAVVAETPTEMVAALDAFLAGESRPGLVSGQLASSRTGRTVFVFPGQGSQWLGMGRELRAREPAFRDSLESSEAAIRTEAGFSLLDELDADPGHSRLAEIDVVQPVLFAIEVALAALWRAHGIQPDVMVGHSMGEVAAAHAAGILSLEDATRVICRRSRLLRRTRGQGAMAVVELSFEEASRSLAGYEDRLSVAVSNSSRSSVLSGDPAALDRVIANLETREVFCRRVKVDVASHSPQMDPLAPELLAALTDLAPSAGTLPLFSTVAGAIVGGATLDASYWVRNLRQPVLFSTVVKALAEQGFDTFIEMSPHPILLPAIQQELQLAGRQAAAVPSLKRDEREQLTFLESLAALYTQGHAVDWPALDAPGARLVSLPAYPWQRERFWLEVKGPAAARPASGLLGPGLTSSLESGTHFWEVEIGQVAYPYLGDHTVNGVVVLPAAAFVEMTLAAAAELGANRSLSIVDLAIENALVLPAEGSRRVQIAASPGAGGEWSLRISSSEHSGAGAPVWTAHARANARSEALPAGAIPLPAAPELSSDGSAHYAAMAARGLEYGPAFRSVQATAQSAEGSWGRLALPDGVSAHGYRAHPSLLDGCFQLGLAALPETTAGETYVPVAIEALRWLGETGAFNPHTARAVLRPAGSAEFGSLQVDIAVADEAGRLLLQVEGLRFQHVPRSFQAVADSLFAVAWDKAPRAPASAALAAGDWLILADAAGTGAALAARLLSRGHSVEVIHAADIADGDRFHALLGRRGPGTATQTVVHLASLDARSPETGGLEALTQARALTCDAVVRLVRAAAAQSENASPRVVLVSAGGQAVSPGEVPAVEQSPLWGLGRAIASEHPELRCGLVDLPSVASAADLDALTEVLCSEDAIEQVALRGGERYTPCLRPWKPEPARSQRARTPAGGRPFRAVASTPGILEGLVLRAQARRAPNAGQVEIEVQATGLNFMNVMSALGILPGYPGGLGPLGIECAGRVATVGEGVPFWKVGDEVVAIALDSLATHALADASLVRRKPAALGFAEAASLPIAFITAHHAFQLAHLGKGERVLVHAAAGGVGLAALQLARLRGAEVLATAGTPDKRRLLESMGVGHVMDSRSLAFREEVLARTGGEGVDVVLNSLSGEFIPASLSVLKPYGRFLEIGKRDIYRNTQIGLSPFQRNLSYFAIDLDRMIRERPGRVAALLDEVMALVDSGAVSALPAETFPVSRVADAFRHMAQARHTGKIVVTMRDAAAQVEEPPAGIASFTEGTCLITGGLGGLALAVARYLVEQGTPSLALVGRRAPNAAAKEAISALERAGARVATFQGDVANAADVQRVLAEIDASLPPLSGIVHAAGLLDDGILLQQTPEKFARVMTPKVEGAWNLHAAIATRPRVGLVLFSSVATLLGLPGQANYAAGNAFLDAIAHARRARGLSGVSINWGPWSDIGLAAAQGNRGARLAQRGLRSLSPTDGIEAFGLLLANAPAQVAVMPLDWASYERAYPASARASFLSSLAARAQERAASIPPTAASGVRETLLAVDPGPRRRAALETYLREQVAQVLRQSPSRIDANKPLKTLGLDSLMGLELRNRLEASLGLTLPATLVWNYPTVATLGPQLAERLGVPLDAAATAPASTPADGDEGAVETADEEVETLLREVERLSAEEARRLLSGGS